MKVAERKTAFEAKQYNPMTLAYLGDAVYELMVREHLALEGSQPVGAMHDKALAFVSAGAQSAVFDQILPCLLYTSKVPPERMEKVTQLTQNRKTPTGRYLRRWAF